MTPWEIRTIEFVTCNCAYGCPCQFNALPTHGNCEAALCHHIEEGHFGDAKLDGLRFGAVVWWPGPIHEGKGKVQPFVDESADQAQREGILKILSGEETDPMATVFAVFATTFEEVFDPIFAPIEFELDVEARRGFFKVPGVAESTGEPIRNPVTGQQHRARIDLPHGFEYELAEMGSCTTTTQGKIALDLKDSYGQFAHIHLNNNGVVRHRSAA